ncbi:MAG: alcohol dehydrogenase catalytic domain-containing protein, partial [Planctomycetia bacterium]
MRAIRLEQPKDFRYVDVADPGRPGPGLALVRTHRMGVCGTDVGGYLGKMPFFRYPRIPGHELGVEVLDVGPDVRRVKIGDRCCVEPYMNCGACHACRKGAGNCCEKLNVIGVMIDGGLCERFLVRADKLHPSPTLSYEQLALVETLAIGCHAADRGAATAADRVLVVGAGPIGLATLEFLRLTGAEITVMDRAEPRLDFCKTNYEVAHTITATGAGEVDRMLELTEGAKYDLVVDATGSNQSMSAALTYAAHTGVVVYVGITTQEI